MHVGVMVSQVSFPDRGMSLDRAFLLAWEHRLWFVSGGGPMGVGIRHLLASSLLDAGYGIAEVAERLGHDPATLMRYYSRVNAARRRQAADHIADLVSPRAAVTHLDAAGEPLVPI
jgi:integrase